jgi:membrane protease YdiL (CAAX protease family)
MTTIKPNHQRTVVILVLLGIGFLVLTRLISEISFLVAKPAFQSLSSLDLDGSFLYISLHHIFQGLLALLAIWLVSRIWKIPFADFGFNTRQWQPALRWVFQFCLFWFILQLSIGVGLVLSGNTLSEFPFPLNARNFGSYFAFQILLSGTGEEPLFRSLVMTPLLFYGKKVGLSDKQNGVIATAIATFIFMIAHINFALNPLRVTHFNILQQLTCLIFGIFYAFLFLRTKSIFGPILAHNWLNGVIVTSGLILILLFG